MFTREIKFKKTLFFVLLSFIYLGCNKTLRIVPCDSLKEKNKLVYLNDSLYTGICEIYKDTILIASRHYKEGQRDGKWEEYYENGTIKDIGGYSKNELSGKYSKYYPDGKVAIKGNFKEGFKDDKWIYFSKTNDTLYIEFYSDRRLITKKNY